MKRIGSDSVFIRTSMIVEAYGHEKGSLDIPINVIEVRFVNVKMSIEGQYNRLELI